jgi:hypothetical protein
MIPINVHDPDYWLQELDPLLKELDFAFQVAVPMAHKFFTDYHKTQVNKPVLSNLIRFHALEYLWSNGFETAREEGEDGWGLKGLPNNGIELRYRQSCIRVRKGIDPPYPTTASSEDFYQQKLFDEMDLGIATNLLVLFNLDGKLQYDGKLRLMRPIGLYIKRKTVRCDWIRTVRLNAADVSTPVTSEYMHAPDLPLDGTEEQRRDTGTKIK